MVCLTVSLKYSFRSIRGDQTDGIIAPTKNDKTPKDTKRWTPESIGLEVIKYDSSWDEDETPNSKENAPLFGNDFARNLRGVFL